MSMTYNSLVATVMNYLVRADEDTKSRVPTFIDFAQRRIAEDTDTLGLTRYVTGTFTAGTWVYPKPVNWQRTVSINMGTLTNPDLGTPMPGNYRNTLQRRMYEFLLSYWPDRTQQDLPLFYTDYGWTDWYIAPTPDQAYPFEVAYVELPFTLAISNQTNWLTDYAPRLLFYATMCEAIPFIKDDERIATWEKSYQEELARTNVQNQMRLLDRGSNVGSG